jgi:hypothetical protein
MALDQCSFPWKENAGLVRRWLDFLVVVRDLGPGNGEVAWRFLGGGAVLLAYAECHGVCG